MEGLLMVRRLMASVAVGLIAVAMVAPVASAAQPVRSFLSEPDLISIPAGGACAFAVDLTFVVNKEYGVTSTLASGDIRTLIGGRLIIRVTNHESGASTVADISGPGELLLRPDGSSRFTLRGNSLPIVPGRLYLTTGTVIQEYASDGSLLSTVHETGTERDLCAVLG
jgi:hypothetical protein